MTPLLGIVGITKTAAPYDLKRLTDIDLALLEDSGA